MYGYNIHSGMPTMHGGLTGHGYGAHGYGAMPHPMHSLGGYLLGGRFEKGVPLDEATKKKMYDARHGVGSYDARLARIALGQPARAPRARKPRTTQRMKIAEHLKHLIDAEKMGARLEKTYGHPELAGWLSQDALYNQGVHAMERYPAYTKKQFGIPVGARAKKGAPVFSYYDARTKKLKLVKEGSAGYVKALAKGLALNPYHEWDTEGFSNTW